MARFLVVDHDRSSAIGMARLLDDDGHDVTPFTTGADAVHALSRESFDVVLTDLDLPRVDGHAVVQATRERHPAACLVVVTARPDEHAQRLADDGVCIVADKPVDYAEVTKSVSECRARGGPGPHGRCHLRSRARTPHVVRLRRK